MAQFIADRSDVDFVLHEQLQIETLSEHEKYAEFNKKTIDLIISEARNLALKELLPIRVDGDREGARFESGKVTVIYLLKQHLRFLYARAEEEQREKD